MLEQFRKDAWRFAVRLLVPTSIPVLFLLGIFIYRPDLAEPFIFVILLVYAALMAFLCWQRVGGVSKLEREILRRMGPGGLEHLEEEWRQGVPISKYATVAGDFIVDGKLGKLIPVGEIQRLWFTVVHNTVMFIPVKNNYSVDLTYQGGRWTHLLSKRDFDCKENALRRMLEINPAIQLGKK